MDRLVEIRTKPDGETHVGVPICEGPKTYRLLLTWPYRDDGRIIEIPLQDIESVAEAVDGPRKEPPTVIENANGHSVPARLG